MNQDFAYGVSQRQLQPGGRSKADGADQIVQQDASAFRVMGNNAGFEYGPAKGGFKSPSDIELMNRVAVRAAVTLAELDG